MVCIDLISCDTSKDGIIRISQCDKISDNSEISMMSYSGAAQKNHNKKKGKVSTFFTNPQWR